MKRAEEVYDPQWSERNPAYVAMLDNMYAEYYRAAGIIIAN